MKIVSSLLIILIFVVPSKSQTLNFVKSSQTFAPAETFQVTFGDLDSDNDLDVVFSNNGFDNSTVWFNNGNGAFTNSGQVLTSQGHGAALGDLDGDNDTDLFMPCAILIYNNVWYYRPSKIYFNNGNGVFTDSGQNLGDSLESKTFVELVDIDFDNDLDAVVQHYETPPRTYYKVYENDGLGNFSLSGLSLPDNSSPTWGDLDNDGDMDIFMKLENQGYSALMNDGTGNFFTQWQLADTSVTSDIRCVQLTDFNGDQDLDAFIINRGDPGELPALVFFNDGSGQFEDSGQRLGSFSWSWIESGDVDADNDSDIVISIFGKPMEVWLNDGMGYFTDSGLSLGGNNSYRGLDLGDIDRDGDVDIFVAYYGQGSNEIWFNDFINPVEDENNSINKLSNQYKLFANYPNPFNPTTKIKYQIPELSFVILKVYDVLGSEIATLANEKKSVGSYEVEFDASNLPSGIYFYKLQAGDFIETKKMLLLK
jgi:hypothetical protein